jgi:hypothetical protein
MSLTTEEPKGIFYGAILRQQAYRATGEYREPNAGEYYLLGEAIVLAWRAHMDYRPGDRYWIAKPVEREEETSE